MTREEAIEIFKDWIDEGVEYDDGYAARELHEEEEQAVNMAIQALSQEPCDDAISREAVIKGIEELKKSPWCTDKRGNGFEYLITEALDVVKDLCIKQAPSVTQKSGKWINDKNDIPICSRCGYIPQYDRAIDDYEYSNFCPNCGAYMVEPQESEDKE